VGASTRLRSLQYIPHLAAHGIDVEVSALFSDDYLAMRYNGKIAAKAALAGYARRLQKLFSVKKFDVIWIEKEVFPWMPAFFELFCLSRTIPILIDYDDAQFHRYDSDPSFLVRIILGRKIDALMAKATVVVSGNAYIAQRAMVAGANRIVQLPTVVDLARYPILPTQRRDGQMLTIGWIGTSITAKYLAPVLPQLLAAAEKHNARIMIVGAIASDFGGKLLDRIETYEWSEATEVALIEQFDIGIMPLPDSPFERGKCAYKLIQYMACAKPVIASPVGANIDVVTHGDDGLLASSPQEWEAYLDRLCENGSVDLRREMGQRGRAKVESRFALQATAPILVKLLESTVEGKLVCAE